MPRSRSPGPARSRSPGSGSRRTTNVNANVNVNRNVNHGHGGYGHGGLIATDALLTTALVAGTVAAASGGGSRGKTQPDQNVTNIYYMGQPASGQAVPQVVPTYSNPRYSPSEM